MPTQAERSSATREKTIAATLACLVERGFHGVTIAAVARGAGVSQGAVRHQYPDKLTLVVEVILEISRRRLEEIDAVVAAAAAGRERIEAGLDMLWNGFKGPIYVAALEAYVGARTDPQLQPRVLQLELDVDAAIRATIQAMTGPTSDPDRLTLQADVFINTLRGLAMLHATGAPSERLESTWAQARANASHTLSALQARPIG